MTGLQRIDIKEEERQLKAMKQTIGNAYVQAIDAVTKGMAIGRKTSWKDELEAVREQFVEGMMALLNLRNGRITFDIGNEMMATRFAREFRIKLPEELKAFKIRANNGSIEVVYPKPPAPKEVSYDFETQPSQQSEQ